MSIRLPEANYGRTTQNGATILEFASYFALQKPASTAFVFGFWMRTLPQGAEVNAPLTIFSRDEGAAGGNDSYLNLNNDFATLRFRLRRGGSDQIPLTSVSTPPDGNVFLVLLIGTLSNFHMVTCEPGGTPNVTTVNSSSAYSNDLAYEGGMFWRIGAGTLGRPFYGEIENVFHAFGEFPEAANVPDTTLIQNIADGTQEISTLASQLTAGELRCHYPLLRRNDYDNVSAIGYPALQVSALTPEDADTGEFYYSGGYLRPAALRPATTGHCLSQINFVTEGTTVGATATLRAEGGSYVGITPDSIEARVVKEDGTALVDWTTIDAAPSGGSWSGADFTDVPATPGNLEIHFRAVDGASAQIGEVVASKGLRGTGFVDHIVVSQSQGVIALANDWGKAMPVGTRAFFIEPGYESMLCSAATAARAGALGFEFYCKEVAARFPGYPVQMGFIGQSGEPLNEWDVGGTYEARFANLANYYGIQPPDPGLLLYGHSDGPASRSAYLSAMNGVRGVFEASFGAAAKIGVMPTPRYAGIGSDGTYDKLVQIRAAQQDFVDQNPDVAFHYGSAATIKTAASATSQPHPSTDEAGAGVAGSICGLGAMARSGAIPGPAKLGPVEVVSDTQIRIPLVSSNSVATSPTTEAPTFTEGASFISQPLVGEAIAAESPTATGTPDPDLTYQYYRGDPGAGGTLLTGETALAYDSPVAADVGARLYLESTASNGVSPDATDVAASGTVAATFEETWEGYSIGATDGTLRASGKYAAVGPTSAQTLTVVANANSATGRGLEISVASSSAISTYPVFIDDLIPAAASVDFVEMFYIIEVNNGGDRTYFRSNSVFGAGFNIRLGTLYHQMPGDDVSSADGSSQGNFVGKTVAVWHRIEGVKSTLRAWDITEPEPGTDSVRNSGSNIPVEVVAIGTRTTGGTIDNQLLYMSVGVNTAAPRDNRFPLIAPTGADDLEFAAATDAGASTDIVMHNAITATVEDL